MKITVVSSNRKWLISQYSLHLFWWAYFSSHQKTKKKKKKKKKRERPNLFDEFSKKNCALCSLICCWGRCDHWFTPQIFSCIQPMIFQGTSNKFKVCFTLNFASTIPNHFLIVWISYWVFSHSCLMMPMVTSTVSK